MQVIYDSIAKAHKTLSSHDFAALIKILRYYLRSTLGSIYLIKLSEQKMLELEEKLNKISKNAESVTQIEGIEKWYVYSYKVIIPQELSIFRRFDPWRSVGTRVAHLCYLLLGWLQDLEGTYQTFINTHQSSGVIEFSTVVWCWEDSD